MQARSLSGNLRGVFARLPFVAAALFSLIQGAESNALSLTFIRATVNGEARSTTNPTSASPMEVIRGQRVAFEYELRNSIGAPVTAGATVAISPTQTTGTAWLAGTPTFTTNQFQSGKYRVEFYLPTTQGAAPINELLYPITIAEFGSEAPTQVTSAIKVVPPPAGLTVIIHGYQPPLLSGCADEGNLPPMDFIEIGSAILARAGKGRLWAFNYQSDTFSLVTTPTAQSGTGGYAGEDVVVVNWCDISNNASPGHGEAVAQGLYAALRTFNPALSASGAYGPSASGLISQPKPIHIIAHSFGASVAFQLARRLVKLAGVTNADVTTLVNRPGYRGGCLI